MLILKGTKTVDLSKDELTEIIGQFDRVHIDLGTGDGRNIYKLAINDQNTFYIGIDPVLGSGEINHSGSGENRQFWSNENHQSGVASPQVVLFTRPAAGQPVSQ